MLTRDVSRAIPAAAVTFAVFIAALVLAPRNISGYDAEIAFEVAHSMVTEGSFRVYHDDFGINTPYSSYGLGLSLLMTAGQVVGPGIGRAPQSLDTLINPALLALIALVIWTTARRLGATPRQATLVSLCVALASPLLAHSAVAFSEVGTALGVAIGLLGIVLGRDRAYVGGVVAGAGFGLAGLMRTDSFVLVAPIIAVGVLVATQRRWHALAGVAIGALPGMAITVFYNMSRFGSPLATEYAGFRLSESFTYPFWSGLYGLIASPGRGILFYAPIVVLVAVGARWSWQRSPLLTVVCLVLMVDRVAFYASWWAWHGGTTWGPRFLVPAMPALVPFVLEVVRRLPHPRGAARAVVVATFAALLLLSASVQIVGAATYAGYQSSTSVDAAQGEIDRRVKLVPTEGRSYQETSTSPAMMAAWSEPLMEWSLFPLKDHTQQLIRGEHVTSRYLAPPIASRRLTVSALLFVFALAAAWIAGSRKRLDESAVPAAQPGPATLAEQSG